MVINIAIEFIAIVQNIMQAPSRVNLMGSNEHNLAIGLVWMEYHFVLIRPIIHVRRLI